MPIKFETYDVLYLAADDTTPVETEVLIYKSDELRAELEGRRFNLRGPVSDGKTVTDFGDSENMTALKVWAALVRTQQYTGASADFRLKHCLGFEKRKAEDVDPTPPAINTGVDLRAPQPSAPSSSG